MASDKTCEKLITRKVLCFLVSISTRCTRLEPRYSKLSSFEDRVSKFEFQGSVNLHLPDTVCGGMKPTNWVQIKDQWKRLRDIPFPKLGKRSKIVVLIGSDDYNLLFTMKEVRGGDNEPSARLCPLGWTAIGTIGTSEGRGTSNTGYLNTYRIQQSECSDGDLNYSTAQK